MILKESQLDQSYVLTAGGELTEAITSSSHGAEELFRVEIQRAFCQGREEGERLGYAKASEERRHLCQLLHTLADHLVEHRKQLLLQLKPEVLDLAFQMAEKLTRQELTQPKPMLQFLNALLTQATSAFAGLPIKLFLAPENLLEIEQELEKLTAESKEKLQILSDPKLRPGDCRIESEIGLLNAEIKKQLEHLKTRLI